MKTHGRNPFPSSNRGEKKVEAGPVAGALSSGDLAGRARPVVGPRALSAVAVKRHPSGGFTHAIRTAGTAAIYRGNWPTKRAAVAAL
jgi:hypothetical protein